MRERYSFRFTHEEIAEMGRILEGNGHSRPQQAEMEDIALSFSKVRQEQGMTRVRVQSVQSWFKRRRGGYTKSRTGRSREKSRMNMLAARPSGFAIENHVAKDEASERSSSNEGSSEDEMSDSMDSEGGNETNIQCQDVPNSVDCSGGPKSILGKSTESSILLKIGQAKATMEMLKGLSLVDFRKYEERIKSAVKILLEEGDSLLSECEKTELPLLLEKLPKIAEENERVRKELADCEAFLEKVEECEENTVKLMEKATALEEKYNAFPRKIPTLPNIGNELEAAVIHVKAIAKAEKMKGDKEDLAKQLVRITECLQSAITHHKILKGEEEAVIQKRNKLMESLRKNTEEWVKLTDSKTYMSI